MRIELFFRDVKPGERFVFATQLFAGEAVKTRPGTFTDSETHGQVLMTCVVVKVDESRFANVAKVTLGHPVFMPDTGLVEVDRTLPSGN